MFANAAHKVRASVFGHRYDYDHRARVWLILQMVALTVGFTIYLAAHFIHKPENSLGRLRDFVKLDGYGVARIISPEDIDWFVGPEKSKPLLTAMNQRNHDIIQLRQETAELLAKAAAAGGDEVREALARITEAFVGTSYALICEPDDESNRREVLACVETLTKAIENADRLAAGFGTADGAWVKWRNDSLAALQGLQKKLPAEHQSTELKALATLLGALEQDRVLATMPARDAEEIRRNAGDFASGVRSYRGALRSWLDRSADPLSVIASAQAELQGVRLAPATESALSDIRSRLARLQQLRVQQISDVQALRPPLKQLLFWVTPMGMLAEILCWGFFGVMTNMLLNTAAAMQSPQADGRIAIFKPREVYIGLAKMVYGPAISLVLCLSILTGLFDLLGTDIRVWALPLVSFFFGFNSRKSAALIDRISLRIFGAAEKSVDEGGAGVAQRRAARLAAYTDMLKPVSLDDLRTQGQRLVDATVQTIVTQKEGRR